MDSWGETESFGIHFVIAVTLFIKLKIHKVIIILDPPKRDLKFTVFCAGVQGDGDKWVVIGNKERIRERNPL